MSSITIVIPVLNEAGNVKRSIARSWASGCDQVIVVDGGSTDGTREICLQEECLLVEATGGRGPQLNAGGKAATSEFILFLHADNWLIENGCRQILAAANHPSGLDYGGFRQKIENDGWHYRWIERGNGWRVQWRGLIYGDQAFFIRRKLFDELGGFPAIPLMEDLAFSMTLKRAARRQHYNMQLLEGPTMVGARRWEQHGVVRQTLKNWMLSTAYMLGVSPQRLAKFYRRHDQMNDTSKSN